MFATLLALGASDCALGVRAVPEPCGSTVGPWQSYGRAASRGGLIVCNQQEQTDDLSFAARHARMSCSSGAASRPTLARPGTLGTSIEAAPYSDRTP